MATKFSEIYTLFLGQIDDYELAAISADEMDYVLNRYMLNAITNIQDSMQDIDEILDYENKTFTEELGFTEKSIFAKAMKLEWLREKKYSSELMQKAIGDRDFTAVQGYNYLKEINAVEKDLAKEIKNYLIDYSYREEFISDWIR